MTSIITAYEQIPEERRKTAAEELHEQVCADAQRVAASMFDFCRSLKTMRDTKLYAELGCESFDEYVESRVGLKRRQVYNYIQTYERLGSTVLQSNAHLGITKLQLLCEVSAPDIPAFLEDNDLAGMTVAEIKKLIEEQKGSAEQISFLQEQVKQLEERPVEVAVSEIDEETIQRIRKEEEDKAIAKIEANKKRYEKTFEDLRRQVDKLNSEKEKLEKKAKKAADAQEKALEKARKEAGEQAAQEANARAVKAEEQLKAMQEQTVQLKASAEAEAKKMAESMNKKSDADLIEANFHLQAVRGSLKALTDVVQKIRAKDEEKARNVAAAIRKLLAMAAEGLENEG